MSRADIDGAIDPESLPLLSQERGPSRLQGASVLDSPGLLDPVTRGSIPELQEEPPWIAEFFAQYRLLFGSSSRIAPPPRVDPEPVRPTEPPPAPPPFRAETAPSALQESLTVPAVSSSQPPEQTFQSLLGPPLRRWSWSHTGVVLAVAALLGALALISLLMRSRHDVKEKGEASTPVVSFEVGKVEAAPPVTAVAMDEHSGSKESSNPFVKEQAIASPESSHALNPLDSGVGQVPHSVAASAGKHSVSSPLSPAAVSHRDASARGVPLRQVQPIYPSDALLAKVQGLVALQAEISQDGKVKAVRVLSGDPILAKAAVVAVRQWIYPPSPSDEPEPRQQQITIRFTTP